MINSITNSIQSFNTACVQPTIESFKKHKVAVLSAIGIGILLGAVCYTSPPACDMMKKSVKLLTIGTLGTLGTIGTIGTLDINGNL